MNARSIFVSNLTLTVVLASALAACGSDPSAKPETITPHPSVSVTETATPASVAPTGLFGLNETVFTVSATKRPPDDQPVPGYLPDNVYPAPTTDGGANGHALPKASSPIGVVKLLEQNRLIGLQTGAHSYVAHYWADHKTGEGEYETSKTNQNDGFAGFRGSAKVTIKLEDVEPGQLRMTALVKIEYKMPTFSTKTETTRNTYEVQDPDASGREFDWFVVTRTKV